MIAPTSSENGLAAGERGLSRAPNLIGPVLLAQNAQVAAVGYDKTDKYPADQAEFRRLLQVLKDSVLKGNGAIAVRNFGSNAATASTRVTYTRDTLAAQLAKQFFNGKNSRMSGNTNALWMQVPASVTQAALATAISAAFTAKNRYATGNEWNRWSGDHWGAWYQDESWFADAARWEQAELKETQVPGDIAVSEGEGKDQLRNYNFQRVSWWNFDGKTPRLKHTGWNQSHRDVPYVWGWDPKDRGDNGGYIGTHLGFPFELDRYHFIVWVCFCEIFLECVDSQQVAREVGGKSLYGYPKSSTREYPGWGQWMVVPLAS